MRTIGTTGTTRVVALAAAMGLVILGAAVTAATAQTATGRERERLTVAFVPHVVDDRFMGQTIDGARAAADDLGVDLWVAGPDSASVDEQLAIIRRLQAEGADGIAVSAAGPIAEPLNEIIDAGTPVVQFTLLDPAVRAPYVGERTVEGGRLLGSTVVDLLGGEDAEGNVHVGSCLPGFTIFEDRSRGVREALASAPGLVVDPRDSDVGVGTTANLAAWETVLDADRLARALIGLCAADVASLGQLQKANPDIDFIAAGYDLSPRNIEAIEDGSADVLLGQVPFLQGYLPVKMLVDILAGTVDVDPQDGGYIDPGSVIVTREGATGPFGLSPLPLEGLTEMAADPAKARSYYQPLIDDRVADWPEDLEPIENRSR
jgi:ABC-type sugar transport system substrate-binding protein